MLRYPQDAIRTTETIMIDPLQHIERAADIPLKIDDVEVSVRQFEPGAYSTKWSIYNGRLIDLVGHSHTIIDDPFNMPGFTLIFGFYDTTSLLGLDYYYIKQAQGKKVLQALANSGLAYLAYTDWNHQEQYKHRWNFQIFIPLSRSIMIPRYRIIWQYTNELLGNYLPIDSWRTCRYVWTAASCPIERQESAKIWKQDGLPLDVDRAISAIRP